MMKNFLLANLPPAGEVNITAQKGVDRVSNVGDIASAALGAAFLIAFLLVFVMLVWGGIQWVTSGGDKENTQKARDRITHALVGVAIIAGAWALMKLVEFFFGITILGGFELPSAAGGGGRVGGSQICSSSSAARCQDKNPGERCDAGGEPRNCRALNNQLGGDGKVKCECR